jgi:hypothetical protein
MMRVKLNLTDEELMNKSWISLCMETADLPYYDPKAKTVIKGKAAKDILNKYIKP